MAAAAAQEEEVIIVGAGQSGLAVSACLSQRGVKSLILERDDCVGSLWRKRAYDRLHLHLAKQYCALPHLPHPDSSPTYLPRDAFADYLDAYASRFGARTRLRREVTSARFDAGERRWVVDAVDLAAGGEVETYTARFLVVASGENDERFVPEVPGIEAFTGAVMHAAEYRSAKGMGGKAVLVVGCGNSGMEIAYDLAVGGAVTSIVARGELHLVTKEIWNVAMALHGYHVPAWIIDKLVLLMCAVVFGGDTARHGLRRPAVGPFTMKLTTPAYPVVDRPRRQRRRVRRREATPFRRHRLRHRLPELRQALAQALEGGERPILRGDGEEGNLRQLRGRRAHRRRHQRASPPREGPGQRQLNIYIHITTIYILACDFSKKKSL
ncbi:hypothetical protein HU200_021222 [Digitaria exilis]|uniref:indole-3-pyruvate monooxygenase n=1 Tax=Digitaria exilis TaxID=1010633 RepID=A0A835F009_9POAL|nr:hypothetical protein HU200_021222 [Digitaria exilis]